MCQWWGRMSRPSRDPGNVLAGVFLILFGLSVVLAGGACSIVWVSFLYNDWAYRDEFDTFSLAMLLVAIVSAGLGALCVERGIRFAFLREKEREKGDGDA